MRITIERSGGYANIPLRREVETATLPRTEAAEIERLIAAARKERTSATPLADGFTYEITIDGVRHVINESEGAWSELIARLST